MATGESVPSDLELGLARAPGVLLQNKPLNERLDDLCRDTAALLDCDRCSILLWDGEVFRGAHCWGYSADIAATFDSFVVTSDKPYIKELEVNQSFLVISNARERPDTAGIANMADIESAALALMVAPDGSPVGILSTGFTHKLRSFDGLQSFIVVGAAQLAQAAILSDRERQHRIELSEAVLEVEDNERRRIGRDIHDDALQRAFAVCLRLEALQQQLGDPTLQEELGKAIKECRRGAETLRDLVNNVHPEGVRLASLAEVLQRLIVRSAEGQHWRFTFEDTCTTKPSLKVSEVFGRIAEQAMHNIRLHSKATTVDFAISTDNNGTRMTINDNGQGFDTTTPNPGRLGLISMRERAELNGGDFTITSIHGTGTTIDCRIPHEADTIA